MSRRGENIYKRKDGRYEGRYIKYRDQTGKAIYGYVYSKSYSEIKQKLIKIKNENHCPGSSMIFNDWLEFWIKTQTKLKPTTLQTYKSYIRNHIKPLIGNLQLNKITDDVLQDFINNLNLSATSVKTILSITKSALSAARCKGYTNNIHNNIRSPRKSKNPVKILTLKEQQRLEESLESDEDIGILICLYTGLRIGEVCALRWCDINFETAVMTINGTQIRTANGLEISEPKSCNSKREIPIPAFLLNKIKKTMHNSMFVLTSSSKPYDLRSYRRHFKKILQKADLPDIKFHSLRHTFATRALEVGMDYKTLSELLGHASVGITLDLYAHSLKEHKTREMNKLNSLYLR